MLYIINIIIDCHHKKTTMASQDIHIVVNAYKLITTQHIIMNIPTIL